MQVLKPVAAATSKVSALKGLSLKESVSQFSSTMTAQADLRVECAHLRRFYNNFASVSQSVTPPYPFPGCETAEVLIETFEPGEFGPHCVEAELAHRVQIEGKACPLQVCTALCGQKAELSHCVQTEGKDCPLQVCPLLYGQKVDLAHCMQTEDKVCPCKFAPHSVNRRQRRPLSADRRQGLPFGSLSPTVWTEGGTCSLYADRRQKVCPVQLYPMSDAKRWP